MGLETLLDTHARLHGSLRGAGLLLLSSLAGCVGGESAGEEPAPVVELSAAEEAVGEEEAPRSGGLDRLVAEGWRVAESKEGHFVLAWRPVSGDVPRNREFDMEVLVQAEGELLEGSQVRVRGWMPDHGHGLNRRPPVSETRPGRYLVEGMVLHMRGHWQVFFDVIHEGVGDTVEFREDL